MFKRSFRPKSPADIVPYIIGPCPVVKRGGTFEINFGGGGIYAPFGGTTQYVLKKNLIGKAGIVRSSSVQFGKAGGNYVEVDGFGAVAYKGGCSNDIEAIAKGIFMLLNGYDVEASNHLIQRDADNRQLVYDNADAIIERVTPGYLKRNKRS